MKTKILILIVIIIAVGGSIFLWQKGKDFAPAPGTEEEKEIAPTSSLKDKLVALGSSLTKASNLSTDKQGENDEYSFSVGTKIDSLYLYLKEKEKDLTFVNLASPGAEMKDILERQLSQALSYNPKYITMDPGADIVTKNSVKDFKQNLSEIIKKISSQTTVFLFTYPNFVKMRLAPYSSCSENKIGVNLDNLREDNIMAFNQAIKEVMTGRENVILLDIYNLLGPEDISDYDCLHINVEGQEKIAAGFIKILNSK